MNKGDSSHSQLKRQKLYDHTTRCRRNIFNIKHSYIVWKDSSNYEYQWRALKSLRVSTQNYSKHFEGEMLKGIR